MMGGCTVIQEKISFDPGLMLKTIEDEKITDVQIVATQLIALLNCRDIDRYDLGSLKRIWYAASPMPQEVLKRGLDKFGPIFMQGYGMTESGPNTACMLKEAHVPSGEPSEGQNVLASCGRPFFGVQMRVVSDDGEDLPPGEIGEIIVHTNLLMSGYWGQPEKTEDTIKNGWLYTGDMGYYDKNAYIYIVDRKKDLIITGGENVYSREVEDVLYEHPAVYETAVIGIPDSYWVERVHALIVLRPGGGATEEEIISFCRQRMAKYKAPKSIEFLKELPKSPQGKILTRELRKRMKKESE
jgi:acyl-CoA synthetase (AMP-forming)/AMP-acid ligase II